MIILINHSPAIPPCAQALHALHDGYITLSEFFSCIDIIERTIRLNRKRTNGESGSRSRTVRNPSALPLSYFYSFRGRSPRAPLSPSRHGIKQQTVRENEVRY